MAIRLRRVSGCWVALCAAETDPKDDDVYLDDSQHYAISCKFAFENDLYEVDERIINLMETQKVRDAREEIEKWLYNQSMP